MPSIFLTLSDDEAISETDLIKGSAAPAVVSYKKSTSFEIFEFMIE